MITRSHIVEFFPTETTQQHWTPLSYGVSESINEEPGVRFHSSRRVLSRSKKVCGIGRRPAAHLPGMSQTCSIGFMSGEQSVHSIRMIPSSKRKSSTKLARCGSQLSFIIMTSSPIAATTATAGSDVVQSGRPIFDDLFQHLWLYIGNNTANVVFQMVKRLWLIRIDQ
ncbi:hypothetical protein TNCV_899231 [Trichonephila clavipes]|nr:hypothetical protein TNCV_899231 [Trichonephila clavipes]